jgi:hypothetical protein
MFDVCGTYPFSSTEHFVGIIGSRNPSKEEWNTAYHLGKRAAEKGKIVVSGLAVGIDTAAHRGALDAGGITIAILNTPKKQASVYPPENRSLAEQIRNSGCLIHPYTTTDSEADRLNGKEKGLNRFSRRLIERDILLARLCPVIIAVKDEGRIEGGTKWAVNYGIRFQKDVLRCDTSGTFHSNPDVEHAKVWWDMELVLPT